MPLKLNVIFLRGDFAIDEVMRVGRRLPEAGWKLRRHRGKVIRGLRKVSRSRTRVF